MNEYQVVAIRPDAPGGVEQAIQVGLDEVEKEGWELKTLIPYSEGLLAVFVREFSRKH
jgi:hypothetical protein